MSCEIHPALHNHQPTHQEGTIWAGMAWTKMAKNFNFWVKLCRFRAKILIITGESKSLGTHITKKNTWAPCLHCILVRHVTKWAKNANIWPKMTKKPIFGQISPLSSQKSLFFRTFNFFPYIHFRSISLQYVVDEFRRFCWNAANSSDLCTSTYTIRSRALSCT